MFNRFIIYWVMCAGTCMVRTQDKHHAFISAYVYKQKNPKAVVNVVACNDYCVPTLNNRVWDECAYVVTPESAWEIAELNRKA